MTGELTRKDYPARGLVLLWALLCAACSDTNGVLKPATVQVLPDTVNILIGQARQLTAVVLNADGAQLSGLAVTFTSSDVAVATTTPGGMITAVGKGTATITAATGGVTGDATVFVTSITAARVSLNPDSIDLSVGSVAAASTLVLDSANNVIPGAPVTYSSSDANVFTVSVSGVVTAVSSGVALLRAVSGTAKDSSPVVVYRPFPGTLQPRAVVSSRPFGVTISSQNVMYVTQQDADSLTRFNLPSLTAASQVGVGDDPGEVVFTANGLKAYTTNVLGNSVSSINVGANTAAAPWAVGGSAWRLRLSKDESVLYVTTNAGNVRILDAATGTGLGTIAAAGGPANGMALSSDGSRLYVSSTIGGIAEINTITNAVLRTFTVPGVIQDIALSPDGTEIYAANENGSLKVVRVATGLVTDTLPLSGGPFGLTRSPNGYFIAVSLASGGKVVILDRVLRRVVRQFDVGGTPRRIAFDAASGTMAVANESNGVDVVR